VELVPYRPWRNAAALRALPATTRYIIAFPAALMVWPFFLSGRGRRILLYVGNDVFAVPEGWRSPITLVKWVRRLAICLLCALGADVIAARGRVLAERFSRFNSHVIGRVSIETLPITLPLGAATGGAEAAPRQPFVLFVGKLIDEKGIGELLEAYRTNPDPTSLLRLVVAGEGSRREDVRAMSAADDRIEYLGFLNDPGQLAGLYARASAVLLPTRGEWEGVPRVLTEAEAFGAPIWATPLPTTVGEFRDRIRYFRSARPSPAEIAQVLRSVAPFHGLRQGRLEGGGAAALQHLAALRDRDLSPPGVSPGLSTPEGRP
jgi:glycosyltransferase involved in cell wall biosynthesis